MRGLAKVENNRIGLLFVVCHTTGLPLPQFP
nr:MAG TPA: hypothetical protein [Caudoviricetes sp.]